MSGVRLNRSEETPEGVGASSDKQPLTAVDQIVAATGFRPDLTPVQRPRFVLDPVTETPVALAR